MPRPFHSLALVSHRNPRKLQTRSVRRLIWVPTEKAHTRNQRESRANKPRKRFQPFFSEVDDHEVACNVPPMSLTLNALCQSPISEGMAPSQALHNTVDLAKRLEAFGYKRLWLAEHHSDPSLASSAPEIMISHIASVTNTIRIGSGGVLLPFYSPFKVAEQFNVLATLFPGRIDLGLGRSAGSEGQAPAALGLRNADAFKAVDELLSWLGPGASKRPYPGTFASPACTPAEPWVLGTSPASAKFAGERGLPYAFGGFLDPRNLMPALQTYHQSFQPGWSDRPRVNLGWYVQAAESEAEANELTRCSEHWFIKTFLRGQTEPFPSPAQTAGAQYGPHEQMALQMRRSFALVGTADQVLSGLESMQKQYAIDEFTLVTIPFEHEARVNSYELLAQA
jgi:luciferase family oxidoreductase group 1